MALRGLAGDVILARLDWLQTGVAIAALIGAVSGLGGFWLQWRKDSSTAAKTAETVAAEVTNAALKVQNAALDRAERDIKLLRSEVRTLSEAVEHCEVEKAGLAARVRELEAAR